MDKIIASVESLNDVLLQKDEREYDDRAAQAVVNLKNVSPIDAATVLATVQALNPAIHTIPLVFLLGSLIEHAKSINKSHKLPQSVTSEGSLWPEISRVLTAFDPIQARYVGHSLLKITETVFTAAEQTGEYVQSIQLLQEVILRLDPTSSTLTTTHFYFLRLCALSRAYDLASLIVNRPIYHIPSETITKDQYTRLSRYLCSSSASSHAYLNSRTGLSGKITSRIFLEYYFLVALIYVALRQWRRAAQALEVVLVHPTHQNSASLIQLEAYRKLLLVNLILYGGSREPPRAMSGNALKHIRALARPYECVVEAFKTGEMVKVQAEIQEGIDVWTPEGNYGLMTEVLAAFRRWSVVRLGDIFAAITIEEVARRTSPVPNDLQECLAYLLRLIETSELKGTIVPSHHGDIGVLKFSEGVGAALDEVSVAQQLQARQVELQVLLSYIQNYDHELEASKDYLEHLAKMKRARDTEKKTGGTEQAIGGAVGGMSMPGGMGDLDEDMMED